MGKGGQRKKSRVFQVAGLWASVMMLMLVFVPASYPAATDSLVQPAAVERRALQVAVGSASEDASLLGSGQPWAVWEVDDGTDIDVYYSRWQGGDWAPPRALRADPEVLEHSPSLAFNPEGTVAWVAWVESVGQDRAAIYVSRWADGAWSAPEAVPGTGALRGSQPSLAVAPDGAAWLAWIGHDGTDGEVYASRWDGAAWSEPWQVGQDDSDPLAYDTQPRLVVNEGGQAWLVWVSYEGELNDEVYASSWDGKGWSAQQRVSAADDVPDGWPAVALDAEGQPWVAWHGTAVDDSGRYRIYLSHWDAENSAWVAEALVSSPPYLPVNEEQPSLAFDTEGKLHLAWETSGARSGIAHTAWDGVAWTAPTWTETEAGSPVLLANGEMRVLWLEPGRATPVQPRDVGEVARPLSDAMLPLPTAREGAAMAVPNRHLAHGDSITWGGYNDPDGSPATPYPVVLEQLLDSNVVDSEVINHGKPGEKARAAEARLREGMELYQPEFVQIMEGTNDISVGGFSAAETVYHVWLLVQAVKEYTGAQVVISTLTPRQDQHNQEVAETNALLKTYKPLGSVPKADAWQAFHNYGPWEQLYVDLVHPGSQGLAIIANTFFQKMVEAGMLPQDPNPPTAQITSLPSQSGCFVPVQWTGDDGGGSGVATFDVQVQINGGVWTMWLPGTPQYGGFYIGADGQNLSFRVRARDKVGNEGAYSAPRSTQVRCNGVIYHAHLPTVKRNSAATR